MNNRQPAVSQNPKVFSRKARRALGVLTITLLVFLSGCVTVDVINLSELNVRVLIRLPDAPGGYTRLVRPAGTTSTFSNTGGRVTIQTLPDDEYRALLESLRNDIVSRLYEEGSILSAEEVGQLVNRLEDIDQAIQALADDGASCTLRAPDFSSVTAIINWDTANGKWSLDCSVAADEN